MKYYSTILFLCVAFFAFGQKDTKQSFEFQVSNIYYLYLGDYSITPQNHLNYGFTLLYSPRIAKNLYTNLGVGYATMNKYYITIPGDFYQYYERSDDYTKYINLLLMIEYRFFHTKGFSFKISQGPILNHRADHDWIRSDVNGTIRFSNTHLYYDHYYNNGLSYRLSSGVSYKRSEKFNLNLSLFMDYKFILYFRNNSHGDIYNDRFSGGINLGIEYKIN